MESNFFANLPFSYLWIVRRAIGRDITTIVDLGCGDGEFMQAIKRPDWRVVGVELDLPSVKKARDKKIYEKIIVDNVATLKRLSRLKFDEVVSSQVLEHLPRKVAVQALGRWEKLAKRRIVVSTTVGFMPFAPIEKKSKELNPLQKHLSGWSPKEFRERGYTVYGQGLRAIYGKNGLARYFPVFFPLFAAMAFVFAPLVYIFPELGTYMVAVKNRE